MLDSYPAYRLGAPVRSLRLPDKGPLSPGQRPRLVAQVARVLHDLTSGQDGEAAQAKIDPNIVADLGVVASGPPQPQTMNNRESNQFRYARRAS
jgi:hypothetical protein